MDVTAKNLYFLGRLNPNIVADVKAKIPAAQNNEHVLCLTAGLMILDQYNIQKKSKPKEIVNTEASSAQIALIMGVASAAASGGDSGSQLTLTEILRYQELKDEKAQDFEEFRTQNAEELQEISAGFKEKELLIAENRSDYSPEQFNAVAKELVENLEEGTQKEGPKEEEKNEPSPEAKP